MRLSPILVMFIALSVFAANDNFTSKNQLPAPGTSMKNKNATKHSTKSTAKNKHTKTNKHVQNNRLLLKPIRLLAKLQPRHSELVLESRIH